MRARLVEFVDIAPAVRHFTFETVGESGDTPAPPLEFMPGQFVSLHEKIDGKEITRAYSIASEPSGNRFVLCLNRVEDGRFSPYLFDLPVGGVLHMLPPLGTFTLRQPPRDALLIATGTGIAPFRSMLRAYLPAGSPSFTLLFGARSESTLLYGEELDAMARHNVHFRFMPTLTQPSPSWTGRTGRVQLHLAEALSGRTDIDVYLCGMHAMVDSMRDQLKQLGFDRKQIRYEKYD